MRKKTRKRSESRGERGAESLHSDLREGRETNSARLACGRLQSLDNVNKDNTTHEMCPCVCGMCVFSFHFIYFFFPCRELWYYLPGRPYS